MDKAQIPLRSKGQTTCSYHKREQLDHYCERCKQLACTNCLSTIHKGHPLCTLNEITPQRKEDIRHFIDKTEKDDLVQIDQYITAAEEHLKDNTSYFRNIAQQLETQTNKLKDKLDRLKEQTLRLYLRMEEDNTKLLQSYKQDLEIYSTQLKQKVKECETVLKDGSDIQTYDTESELNLSTTVPERPILGSASFSPNQNPEDRIEQAYGKVYISSQVDLESPCGISSVCPNNDGQVWTRHFKSDTLTLLDRKGKIIQEVQHNSKITDISLSPTTNTLWVCDWNNSITELVSGHLVHRFSTKEEPQCICITASNHVIVGMEKQISKFTTDGTLVQTTLPEGAEKPLVCSPYKISECPVTHNVAVADSDDTWAGGDGNPHVVVMNTCFSKLFVYNGEVPPTYQPPSQSGRNQFDPCGLVYDSVGILVIADRKNNRILLISGRGEFIRFIYRDDHSAQAVGVDREDVLWAVFGSTNVKLLQYSRARHPQR